MKEILKEIKRGQLGHGILVENDGFVITPKQAIRTIKESIENGGWDCPNPFKVPAVFQKFGIKNANGRIYPEEVLREQVKAYQKLIDERASYGELNHPETTTIDGDRISHLITELHWENSTLVGEMELYLSRPFIESGHIETRGDQTANLLLNGYKIGVSSRGVGSVTQKNGDTIVNDDFEIVCWDVVTSPSTPGAYIDLHKQNLQQYVENKHIGISNGNSFLNEKLDRLSKILF